MDVLQASSSLEAPGSMQDQTCGCPLDEFMVAWRDKEGEDNQTRSHLSSTDGNSWLNQTQRNDL